MADSPVSSLSSHASSEFTEDVKFDDREPSMEPSDHLETLPPSKRQKVGPAAYRSTPIPDVDLGDISSDTSGSAPSSPPITPALMQDDDHGEQVTICRWRDCPEGDVGNMDALVHHIHEDHIGQRQKRYACEWEGCPRFEAPHASGYALRAHMRSHTREKPFYCSLPECDKFFTRSDALVKHMRTVHEIESIRPTEPTIRPYTLTQAKPQRLKLIIKDKVDSSADDTDSRDALESMRRNGTGVNGHSSSQRETDNTIDWPRDLFEPHERTMRPDQLYRLCRRQLHWSEQDGKRLRDECEDLEAEYRAEWQAKELLLLNLIETDLVHGPAPAEIQQPQAESDAAPMTNPIPAASRTQIDKTIQSLLPNTPMPVTGGTAWWREKKLEVCLGP